MSGSVDIEDKILLLEKEIFDVHSKLDMILDVLNNSVNMNCKKMGDHIGFVEAVYDSIRHPLGFLCRQISSFSTYTNDNGLPRIGSHTNHIL